jgi:hypothetical protein
VPLYFAEPRPVVERAGTLILVDDERMRLHPGERVEHRSVRFRTKIQTWLLLSRFIGSGMPARLGSYWLLNDCTSCRPQSNGWKLGREILMKHVDPH